MVKGFYHGGTKALEYFTAVTPDQAFIIRGYLFKRACDLQFLLFICSVIVLYGTFNA